jgi:hypothetical protein
MNRQEAAEKLLNRVKSLNILTLCDIYEQLVGKNDEEHIIVRGYIIDELESRNEDAFDNWMLSDEIDLQDKPSKFFL